MFDPNKYRQIAQQELGPNAFNFNHTANRYALEAEASRLRDKVSSLINDRIKQINSPKKTYQDAVNYWNQNKDLFQKEGAYNVANDIKNDPAKQAEIKAQGYNVEDYLNGLYHAASGGKFRSQREFNQYNSQLKNDISARDKAYKKQHNGLTQDEVYAMQKQANKPKPKGQGVLGNIEGLFKDLGHGVSQRLGETGNELSNIWKAVSDGPGGYTLDNVANATQADIKKRQQADAKRGYSSTLSKEVQRGANRAVDAATLGNMSAYQNAENAKGYGFNTNYANTRQFGKGGATDFLTSGIGYLAPGSASLDLAKGLGLGEKVASKLADKGASNAVQRLAHLGTEGATTGGIFGGMQSIADPNMTLKQRLENVPLNAALGAVADPLLHVAGTKIAQFFGKDKVAKSELDSALNNPNTPNDVKQEILALPEPKMINQPINDTTTMKVPLQYVGRNTKPLSLKVAPNDGTHPNFVQEAAATAPKFENISPENGKLHKLTKSEQQRMKNQDTFAANNTDPTIPDTSGHIVDSKDIKSSPSNIISNGYTNWFDNLHRLNQLAKYDKNITGKELAADKNPYKIGLISRGSDVQSQQILLNKMIDPKGNEIGPSLESITKQVPRKQLKSFLEYIVNKHAITRMKRGEKVFPDEWKMSPEKSQAIVNKYDQTHPKFKEIGKQLTNFLDTLDKSWLVDGGIIPKSDFESYVKANPNYIPMNRVFKEIEQAYFKSAKKGFANQTNPIQQAIGSQRQIINPFESVIHRVDKVVKTVKRNEVMQTLINVIKENPEAYKGFAEILPTEQGSGVYADSVANTLKDEGVNGVLDAINKGFEQKPNLTHGNDVYGFINGKKVHLRVHDPQLLDALTHLNQDSAKYAIRWIANATRIMKVLTTAINPVFSVTRNIWRDIPTAFAFSKEGVKPFQFTRDLLDSFISIVANPLSKSETVNKVAPDFLQSWLKNKGQLYQDFKNMGGGHASPVASDIKLLNQSMRKIAPKKKGVGYYAKKTFSGLENLNNALESAPRLAEYKRHAQKGGYGNKLEGVYQANDLTVNFSKHGNYAKTADAYIPYFNAALQGIDKIARVAVENPKQAAIKAGLSVTLPTILLYIINHNNPNYQQLSNYEKDNNFLIPLPDGTFAKIPKPRELGVLFGSDVERMLRAWNESDPHAFEGFAKTFLTAFQPPTRTIFHPALVDTVANKNYFGTPIVPGDLQNLSPKYQYDAKTSEIGKKIGAALNFSPKKVDYLIKSYGGVLGELGLPATTKTNSIGDTLKQKVTADPVFNNDIINNFYNEKTKLDTAHNDFKKQGVKTPDLNEQLRKVFDSRAQDISDLRKRLKKVLGNQSLTNQQRKTEIRDLQKQMNAIAKQTNQLVR